MTLKAEGRRFVQELLRNRRARLLAHQTIASMDGGWWGGILQNRMRPGRSHSSRQTRLPLHASTSA